MGDWKELIPPNGLGKTGFDNGSKVTGVRGIGCNGRPEKVWLDLDSGKFGHPV